MPGEYTRFWCTLGVRPIKLDARYVRPPSWREGAGSEWEEVPAHKLSGADWVILGDEFAEVQLRGDAVLTRQDLRKACDAHAARADIVSALQR
jgi:hypothetical protein